MNYAPKSAILAVLRSLGVKNASNKTEAIIQTRESVPLDQDAVRFILEEDFEKTPAGQYFGSRTWFWSR